MKKKLIVKTNEYDKNEVETFFLESDSNGKFKSECSETPYFMISTIIRLFDEILKQDKKIGIHLITGLIGGIFSLDDVDYDDILKELDKIKED